MKHIAHVNCVRYHSIINRGKARENAPSSFVLLSLLFWPNESVYNRIAPSDTEVIVSSHQLVQHKLAIQDGSPFSRHWWAILFFLDVNQWTQWKFVSLVLILLATLFALGSTNPTTDVPSKDIPTSTIASLNETGVSFQLSGRRGIPIPVGGVAGIVVGSVVGGLTLIVCCIGICYALWHWWCSGYLLILSLMKSDENISKRAQDFY